MNAFDIGITSAGVNLGRGLLVTVGDITVVLSSQAAAALVEAVADTTNTPVSLCITDNDHGAGWHATLLLDRTADVWALLVSVHREAIFAAQASNADLAALLDAAVTA